MADIAQLTADQNSRIEERKKDFTEAASSFAKLFDAEMVADARLKREGLFNLFTKAKVYFSCFESCIVEGCIAGAFVPLQTE